MSPHLCIARDVFLRDGRNITEPHKRRRNGSACWYDFADRSRFVVYFRGAHEYRGTDGLPYRIRTSTVS
jgi:hypothetical protein